MEMKKHESRGNEGPTLIGTLANPGGKSLESIDSYTNRILDKLLFDDNARVTMIGESLVWREGLIK